MANPVTATAPARTARSRIRSRVARSSATDFAVQQQFGGDERHIRNAESGEARRPAQRDESGQPQRRAQRIHERQLFEHEHQRTYVLVLHQSGVAQHRELWPAVPGLPSDVRRDDRGRDGQRSRDPTQRDQPPGRREQDARQEQQCVQRHRPLVERPDPDDRADRHPASRARVLDLREDQQRERQPEKRLECVHRQETADGQIERRERHADHRDRNRIRAAARAPSEVSA